MFPFLYRHFSLSEEQKAVVGKNNSLSISAVRQAYALLENSAAFSYYNFVKNHYFSLMSCGHLERSDGIK